MTEPLILKTDRDLIGEAKALLDGLVDKMAELQSRGIIVGYSVNNGQDGSPVALQGFAATKQLAQWPTAPAKQEGKVQVAQMPLR